MSNQKSGGVWEDLADVKSGNQRDSRNPDYCEFCGREKSLIAPRTRCTVCLSPIGESIFGQPKVVDCPACDVERKWNPDFKIMEFCMDCPRYIALKNEDIKLTDMLEGARARRRKAEKEVEVESEIISDLVNKINLIHLSLLGMKWRLKP